MTDNVQTVHQIAYVDREMPEMKWGWRRLYSFGSKVVALGIMTYIVHLVRDPDALRHMFYWVTGLAVLPDLLYMGGATMTDLFQLTQAVRTRRTETITTHASDAS